MSEAKRLDDYLDETRSDYPSRAIARKSGGSGGAMDDVLKRLGAVESSVSELRVQVSGVAATIPYLATSADLKAGIGSLRAEISAMETRIIKWIIATVLTSVGLATGLAFSIARLVH
jgi:hypothetical protein